MEKGISRSYFARMVFKNTARIPHTFFLLMASMLLLLGCEPKAKNQTAGLTEIALKYAKGFEIKYGDGFLILSVTQPWTGAETEFRYLVLEDGKSIPEGDFDAIINANPSRIILTSTTHIPHLDFLQISDRLVGFPDVKLISSPQTRKLIDAGKVTDLGSGPSANPELTLDLQPDLMVISTLGEDLKYLEFLKTAGVPAVINGEYVEQHPLGRAEWIKFTGALTGKLKEANRVFDQIEKEYLDALNLAAQIPKSEAPKILSGVMYEDIWYAPGSDSWGAQILKNAGGSYIFENQQGTGSLQLNYEYVLENGIEAVYWIGSADYESLQIMGQLEPRYTVFEAFKTGEVYTYTQKKGATGGLEYFELGYMRPDLILKDMIKIIHPEVLEDHDLYFYQKLND